MVFRIPAEGIKNVSPKPEEGNAKMSPDTRRGDPNGIPDTGKGYHKGESQNRQRVTKMSPDTRSGVPNGIPDTGRGDHKGESGNRQMGTRRLVRIPEGWILKVYPEIGSGQPIVMSGYRAEGTLRCVSKKSTYCQRAQGVSGYPAEGIPEEPPDISHGEPNAVSRYRERGYKGVCILTEGSPEVYPSGPADENPEVYPDTGRG